MATKKQHIVPKFYLKRFSNDQGNLEALDVRNKQILKRRPYSSVCYKDFFYGVNTGVKDEVSQQIETALGLLETQIASDLPSIIEKALSKTLANEDLWVLANFFSMLWMRTEVFRNKMNKMEENLFKQLNSYKYSTKYADTILEKYEKDQGVILSKEAKDKIKETFISGDYSLEFNNALHLQLMAGEIQKFPNLFFNQRWTIYFQKPKGLYKFITSDNPVVEWFPKPKTFYGYTFLERTHCLALTPDIFIELIYAKKPTDWNPIKQISYKNINETKITVFNTLIASHANEYCYSPTKEEFNRMLKEFNRPGKVALKYLSKYNK